MERSHSMHAVIVSRLLGVVLAVVIGLSPIVPPEHVHEGGADHHLVVHSHMAEHLLRPSAGVRHALDDDDAPILTVRAVYAVPGIARIASLPPVTRIEAPDAPVGNPLHRV